MKNECKIILLQACLYLHTEFLFLWGMGGGGGGVHFFIIKRKKKDGCKLVTNFAESGATVNGALSESLIIIIMEICKAPTLQLKALNKHTHIMYIEMENVIQFFFFLIVYISTSVQA